MKNWRWLKGTLPSTSRVFNLNRVQLPFQHYPHRWPTVYVVQELTKSCAFEVFSSVDCRAIHCAIKQLKRNSHSEPNSGAEALCHCSKKGKQLNSVFGCTHWSNQLNAMYRGVSRNPRSTSVHKHTWLHNNSSKLSFLHPCFFRSFQLGICMLLLLLQQVACFVIEQTRKRFRSRTVVEIVIFWKLQLRFFCAFGEFWLRRIWGYVKVSKRLKISFKIFGCKELLLKCTSKYYPVITKYLL